jgi:SAM-dependent methyltransferase
MDYLSHLHGGEPGHYPRYCLAAEWLAPLLTPDCTLVECGGAGPFTGLLQECFGVTRRVTDPIDLRHWEPAEAAADIVLAMEVIEHMKDRDADDRATFCYSGIRHLVAQCFRALKPGGRLFLSTPNPAAYGCLWSAVRGDCPLFYKWHVRELGPLELRWLVEEAGFQIERFEGVSVWPPGDCPEELAALISRLAPDVPREPCLFVLARKAPIPNP